MTDEPDVLRFATVAELEAWMAAEHARCDGIWIAFAKKASGIASVTYAEVLEVALRFGWIDSQVRAIDDRWYRQRFTPRRARSPWSQRNARAAEALIAAGRMHPAGLAEVQRAKADGRWERAYAGPTAMQVPADLQAELDADPAAAAFFARLSSQNRYAILYRIQDAKRPATRARRIATFMEMLRRGETLH